MAAKLEKAGNFLSTLARSNFLPLICSIQYRHLSPFVIQFLNFYIRCYYIIINEDKMEKRIEYRRYMDDVEQLTQTLQLIYALLRTRIRSILFLRLTSDN